MLSAPSSPLSISHGTSPVHRSPTMRADFLLCRVTARPSCVHWPHGRRADQEWQHHHWTQTDLRLRQRDRPRSPAVVGWEWKGTSWEHAWTAGRLQGSYQTARFSCAPSHQQRRLLLCWGRGVHLCCWEQHQNCTGDTSWWVWQASSCVCKNLEFAAKECRSAFFSASGCVCSISADQNCPLLPSPSPNCTVSASSSTSGSTNKS